LQSEFKKISEIRTDLHLKNNRELSFRFQEKYGGNTVCEKHGGKSYSKEIQEEQGSKGVGFFIEHTNISNAFFTSHPVGVTGTQGVSMT
jgi:hypothetical protein